MPDIDTKELRRLMEESTAGKWQPAISSVRRSLCIVTDDAWICGELSNGNGERPGEGQANCDLIVAMHNALPALLSEAEEAKRLREELAALRAAPAAEPVAVGEDIMVNTPDDVYTLPLEPTGLTDGPRFVVHVPASTAPVSLKPLDWRNGCASTSIGDYLVVEEDWDEDPFWFVIFNGKPLNKLGEHRSEAEAISAAQNDYERRIRESLVAAAPTEAGR